MKRPKKLTGQIPAEVYTDATNEHLGWIGRPMAENDLSLEMAKRLHRWLGEVIKWKTQKRKKLPSRTAESQKGPQ